MPELVRLAKQIRDEIEQSCNAQVISEAPEEQVAGKRKRTPSVKLKEAQASATDLPDYSDWDDEDVNAGETCAQNRTGYVLT